VIWDTDISIIIIWKQLFFQNATQVQLHSGKNTIVLYQETKLQFELHVSIEPAAASLQQFNCSGPPPRTRNFLKEHLVHVPGVPWEISCSWRGPEQLNCCKEAAADSMGTCSSNCSFVSWYKTMGVLPPWSCTWVAFWKNSHWQRDSFLCLCYDIIGLFLQKSPIKETVFCKHMSFCRIIHMTYSGHWQRDTFLCLCFYWSVCVCVDVSACLYDIQTSMMWHKLISLCLYDMGWLQLVRSLKWPVSFCKRALCHIIDISIDINTYQWYDTKTYL